MRDEQEGWVSAELRAQPAVVERGHDRLAGSRGSDDEVAPAVVDVALGVEGVENLLLNRSLSGETITTALLPLLTITIQGR